VVIIKPGIRQISDSIRACGFDMHYEFGSLEPPEIGEHEITSISWRDHSYAQIVVRGQAPKDLFKRVVIHLPERPFVLELPRIVGPTVHGDTCWEYKVANPGQHGGEFAVEIS
jgi:hypothetical protein